MNKNLFAVLYVLGFAATLDAQQVIQFRQTTQYRHFAVREPVLRIKPGDIAQATTRPRVGPIYIDGATTMTRSQSKSASSSPTSQPPAKIHRS